jgi:uncharacterized protein (DUF58 family)
MTLKRPSYLVFRFVTGVTYWANRRFTAAGAMVLSGIVVTGAVGVDTTQSVAYQAFSLLAALVVVAVLCLPFLSTRVNVERMLPRIATAGNPFTYRVRVSNSGARPMDGLSLREDFADPRPTHDAYNAAIGIPTYRKWKRLVGANQLARVPERPVPALAPGASVEVEIEALALRRGVAHSHGIIVGRADPLGLVKAIARVPRRSNVTVLPRRYTLPAFPLPGSRRYQPGGVALATSVGDSEEFVGLRDYRPGDPLQRIHWKSFARAARPIVKEYQDEYFERHALVLDTFAAARDERLFEEAVSIAASFAYTIDTRECLLDLMFIGPEAYTYTAGRGQMQAGSLLEILAGVQPCRDKPFSVLGNAVVSRRGALTGCICVLLGWDEERARFLRQLQAHGTAFRAIVVNHGPVANPPAWLLAVEPGQIQEGLARL